MDKEFIHITKDGDKIPLSQMNDSHLINIIAMIKRKAQKGFMQYSGNVWQGEIDCDGESICGEEALLKLNYQIYVDEVNRRQNTPRQDKILTKGNHE